MECLNCKKEITAERESKKYCSDKCRVMWNRKKPKGVSSDKISILALCNQLMGMLATVKFIPLQDSASDLAERPFTTLSKKIKIRRSVQSWLDWKRDIQDEEEYDKFKEEINDADYLTQKEKKYIFNN